MNYFYRKNNTGLTLMELLIIIGILVLLLVAGTSTLSVYRQRQVLSKETETVIETLLEARNLTIVSKNASSYGVHLDTSSITLFAGPSYSSTNPANKIYNLSSGITLQKTLPSGGSDLIFSRLTGETNQSGTALVDVMGTSSTTIRIYKTGVVERVF